MRADWGGASAEHDGAQLMTLEVGGPASQRFVRTRSWYGLYIKYVSKSEALCCCRLSYMATIFLDPLSFLTQPQPMCLLGMFFASLWYHNMEGKIVEGHLL